MRSRPEKRRAERHATAWIGTYSTGTDVWYPCQVLDVSATGAALVLSGPPGQRGKAFTLDLRVADGTTNGIRLRATVRNATSLLDGTTRAGIEFLPLTPIEESLLALLLRVEADVAAG